MVYREKNIMRSIHAQRGFSIIDLMITIAILAIVGGLAVPSINQWSRNYRLQGAVTSLFSDFQRAKLGAVKENRPWTIDFSPGGITGYHILDGNGNPVSTVDFNDRYGGNVVYARPDAGPVIEDPNGDDIITFNPNGLTPDPRFFVHLSNSQGTHYYRIAVPFIAGGPRIERWNGTNWPED
jgi:type IV fimbrial biogenesis protein FimT